MLDLSNEEKNALSAVATALADPSAILERWRENDLFQESDSDGLSLRVGEQGSAAVATAVQRYESSVRRPFPALLAHLLLSSNGMNVEENSTGAVDLAREPSVRDVWNGLLAAEDIESDETSDHRFSGLRFGCAYAQARLILVDNGGQEGAVIFDDAKGSPVVLADTLAGFLEELSAEGMSVEAVAGKRL